MSNEPSEQPGPDQAGDPAGDSVYISPLLPEDPPKVGDYWIDGRLGAVPAGVAFTGHADRPEGGDVPVMVLLLSEGAASDAAARDRFAGLINELHIDTVIARGGRGQDFGRMGRKYRAEDHPVAPDDRPPAPWAALAYDGTPAAAAEAERILNAVQLSWLPPLGAASGPDYRLYWIDKVKPGLTRLWPLPWPGRYDRAGWRSILVSWLLMLLLAALAVLIAILIFHNQAPQSPPPPTGGSGSPPPQSSSPSPQSSSPSPQSGSPSPQSASPSPQSGSPSPTNSGSPTNHSPSQSPSMTGSASPSPTNTGGGGGEPSETATANASESPRSRL
ncbi:hypothetical protein GCM10011575_45670 [Microlunatus endophyticus]|uniref:Uncharacterized protein n=1 Tax=Microlunatus endophyticus TaxID=1716077 RepID=A0A917SIP5_9ACTN|nr:hypothetical protein [Microlunatus endophyticus]GGL82335.1 hypothetical protein GCM10011575_45670 [Microlunatus endophyticus]